MPIQPPPGTPGFPEPQPPAPDFDLHQLTALVNQLEVASNIYRANIKHLTERVSQLEAGNFSGDLNVNGTLFAKVDVVLGQ